MRTPLPFSIRAALPDDVPALALIEAACFADAWTPRTLSTALQDKKNVLLVAEGRNGVLAFASAWVVLDEGELSRVAVSPEARGQGIAFALTQAIVQLCHTRGAKTMFLEVRESNSTARHLYERCGFVCFGVRREYYADGENAVLMEWEFSRG